MESIEKIKERVYLEKIYKYRGVNKYTFEMLINNELYFALPIEFNDPFDCQLPFESNISQEGLIEHFVKDGGKREQIEFLVQNQKSGYEESLKKLSSEIMPNSLNFRVCCFSKRNDIIPMWAYYSDSFKGICLGFDPLKDTDLFSLAKVNYPKENELPKINFFEDESALFNMILTKSNHWNHEEEIRLIKSENPSKKLYKFKPESLTDIIFGCYTSKKDIETIQKLTDGRKEIKYKRIEKSKTKFELDVIDL
jgi:hypothetical protein